MTKPPVRKPEPPSIGSLAKGAPPSPSPAKHPHANLGGYLHPKKR